MRVRNLGGRVSARQMMSRPTQSMCLYLNLVLYCILNLFIYIYYILFILFISSTELNFVRVPIHNVNMIFNIKFIHL